MPLSRDIAGRRPPLMPRGLRFLLLAFGTAAALSLAMLTGAGARAPDAIDAQGAQGSRARIVVGFKRADAGAAPGAAGPPRRRAAPAPAATCAPPARRRRPPTATRSSRACARTRTSGSPRSTATSGSCGPGSATGCASASAARAPNDEGFSVQYSLQATATTTTSTRPTHGRAHIVREGRGPRHRDRHRPQGPQEEPVAQRGREAQQRQGRRPQRLRRRRLRRRPGPRARAPASTRTATAPMSPGSSPRAATTTAAISGLCWKAKMISVRWMDADGRGYTSDAAEAIVYAVDQGARVINASYGSTTPTDVEREAIAYAAAHDTLDRRRGRQRPQERRQEAGLPGRVPGRQRDLRRRHRRAGPSR